MAPGGSYPSPNAAQIASGAGGSYPSPNAASGSAGLYLHNGGSSSPPPSAHQQLPPPHQPLLTDPDLQLVDELSRSAVMNGGHDHDHDHAHEHDHGLAAVSQLPQSGRQLQAQQMAQSVMSMGTHPATEYGHSHPHDDRQRKRSKVSRACDECRRKKIRCDAGNENEEGPASCSSCKRSGLACQFSRQPLKRGPSKGYIKELADRLQSLENRTLFSEALPNAYQQQQLATFDPSGYPSPSQPIRKRSHSQSEGRDSFPTHTGWPETPERVAQSLGAALLTLNDTMPEPANDPGLLAARYSPTISNGATDATLVGGSLGVRVVDQYYYVLHPILPLLSDKKAFYRILQDTIPSLRDALTLSLEFAIRSFSPNALPVPDCDQTELAIRASEQIGRAEWNYREADRSRTFKNQLFLAQSMILMTIGAANQADDAVSAQTVSMWLGRAVGMSAELHLDDPETRHTLRDQDPDLAKSCRRTYWTLFICDRLHASSRAVNILLSPLSEPILSEELEVLGDLAYHLARVADVIGNIIRFVRECKVPTFDPTSDHALGAMMSIQSFYDVITLVLNRTQESFDLLKVSPNTVGSLALRYAKLLAERLVQNANPMRLLNTTRALCDLLVCDNSVVSPVHSYFACLAASSLGDLAAQSETRAEALKLMTQLQNAIDQGKVVRGNTDGKGWDISIHRYLESKLSHYHTNTQGSNTIQGGLQSLADAAVTERQVTETSGSNLPDNSVAAADAALTAAAQAAQAAATAASAIALEQSQYDPLKIIRSGFMSTIDRRGDISQL